jgi:hypothetical protein
MTAPDFSRIEAQMHAATMELRAVMEQAARDLARFERENKPTAQEQRALQEAALRGDLGDDMRRLARLVENGEDSWDAVFRGESPNKELLRGHLDRMIEQNRDAIAQAFEEDDEFDPYPPELDEDPRNR